MSRPPYIEHALCGKLGVCPACGQINDPTTAADEFSDEKTMRSTLSCGRCGAEWCGVYVLAGVQFHEVSDRAELDRWPEYPVADDPRAKDPA